MLKDTITRTLSYKNNPTILIGYDSISEDIVKESLIELFPKNNKEIVNAIIHNNTSSYLQEIRDLRINLIIGREDNKSALVLNILDIIETNSFDSKDAKNALSKLAKTQMEFKIPVVILTSTFKPVLSTTQYSIKGGMGLLYSADVAFTVNNKEVKIIKNRYE